MKSDMSIQEMQTLRDLLKKEMTIYGVISKSEYEENCLFTTWKMIDDYIEAQV